MSTITIDQASDLIGPPTWIETDAGYPFGSVGAEPVISLDDDEVLAGSPVGSFTVGDAERLVAFTEFLAGSPADASEREWLVDAVVREFERDPVRGRTELDRVATATDAVGDLDPVERTTNRHRALTSLYRLDRRREEHGLAENPVLAVIRAHNPPVLVEDPGPVITTGAVEARGLLNELVLRLADRRLDDQPNLRTGLADGIADAAPARKAELAGSWTRLVILRAWLAQLDVVELSRLRRRLGEVVDTATDLDLVGLQLSFRSMIEAVTIEDLDD
ncbi:MAG: hypothetical protein AAGA93_05895 [Actinomycetota bacterium]